MSQENLFGYYLIRCIITGITIVFQLILILSVVEAPIPYLLSNISILGGYMLDIYTFRKEHISLQKVINIAIIVESFILIIAFGDILYIATYNPNKYAFWSYVFVPIITLGALLFYLTINIIITINANKDAQSFLCD